MSSLIKYLILFSLLCFTSVDADTTQPNSINFLTLSTPQTHFVIKRVFYENRYVIDPEYIPLKVIAMYDDGESEEVTDKVTWNSNSSKTIKFYGRDVSFFKKGDYSISASLDSVISNSIDIEVEDVTSKLLDVSTRNHYTRGFTTKETYTKEVYADIKLIKKPTSDVILKLKIEEKDAISFPDYNSQDSNNTHEIHTLRFTPEDWSKDHPVTIYFDVNSTDDYTIVTEPFESQDAYYDGKDAEDIVLKKTKVELIEPPIAQRRGAIRGVTIRFQVQSKKSVVKYALVNPPKGMKIAGRSNFGHNFEMYGTDIEWKVPMDAIEGKTYTITVKATDFEGNTEAISFPIKIPKTKPIQTKLVNNELIVTDKNSPLYGMKMKGHSGEDISAVRLRSVAYRDIQKHPSNVYEVNHKLKYTAFIIDHKPPKLDIDLPNILYFGFYRYGSIDPNDSDPWDNIQPTYTIKASDAWDSSTGRYIIKNNVKGVPQRNEYDDGGNKVYLLVVEDKGV